MTDEQAQRVLNAMIVREIARAVEEQIRAALAALHPTEQGGGEDA